MYQNPLDQIPEDANDKINQTIAYRMRVAGLWMILASAAALGSLFIGGTALVLGWLDGWWQPFRTEEIVVEVFFLVLITRYAFHLASGIKFRSKKVINDNNIVEKATGPYFAGWLVFALAAVFFITAFIMYNFFNVSLVGEIARAIFQF